MSLDLLMELEVAGADFREMVHTMFKMQPLSAAYQIYMEFIKKEKPLTSLDLIKMGYEEATVHRCLNRLKDVGIIEFDSFARKRRRDRGGPRAKLWRLS